MKQEELLKEMALIRQSLSRMETTLLELPKEAIKDKQPLVADEIFDCQFLDFRVLTVGTIFDNHKVLSAKIEVSKYRMLWRSVFGKIVKIEPESYTPKRKWYRNYWIQNVTINGAELEQNIVLRNYGETLPMLDDTNQELKEGYCYVFKNIRMYNDYTSKAIALKTDWATSSKTQERYIPHKILLIPGGKLVE